MAHRREPRRRSSSIAGGVRFVLTGSSTRKLRRGGANLLASRVRRATSFSSSGLASTQSQQCVS